MTPQELLKTITADQLHEVIDADLSAHETGSEDATHVTEWLAKEYPEFLQFAYDCVSRYFEHPPAKDDPAANLIVMNTAITLGAICRAVEAKQLLGEDS